MILERDTTVDAPLEKVFEFFSDPRNLGKITPPAMGFQIVSAPDRALAEGDRIEYRIKVLGLPLRWVTLITTWRQNESFSDLQEKGPYRRWLHTHTFRASGGKVQMHDRVEYELPLGWLGQLAAGWFIRRQLQAIFDYRAQAIHNAFGRESA